MRERWEWRKDCGDGFMVSAVRARIAIEEASAGGTTPHVSTVTHSLL
jgi:hypothetical protein